MEGKQFGAVCKPDLLVIKHGKEGTFSIKKKRNSVALSDSYLANSVTAKTSARRIWDTGLSFVYESKQIDPPRRVVWETVQVKVKFAGKTATKLVNCNAAVVHGHLNATSQNLHDYTKIGVTGSITSTSMDGKTVISGTITPSCSGIVAEGIYGFEVPIKKQHPDMNEVETEMVSMNLNGGSSTECTVTNKKITCLATDPMQLGVNSFFDIFTEISTIPDSMHLHMLDSEGNIIAATDLPHI